MADFLYVAASNFRTPQNPLIIYEVIVQYLPSIPDNINHWQVFEDEEQVQSFMEIV